MSKESIYVLSAKQISLQQPLSEEWMQHPLWPEEPYVHAINPDFKPYIPPMEARRMGTMLKRAVAVSKEALKSAGLSSVDAVITGTGYGCIENTELFLAPLCREGENLLKPTCFMQSTHNTISAQIAIQTHCHAYNMTYAHKHVSFESALYDAYLQFKLKEINTALVGGDDEMTPDFFKILRKGGIFGQGSEVCGETAVAVALGRGEGADNGLENGNSLCRLAGLKILFRPDMETLSAALHTMLEQADCSIGDIDAVFCGISGNRPSDEIYLSEIGELVGNKRVLRYKHLFGQSFTSSGLGFYVASHCLKKGFVPACLGLETVPSADCTLKKDVAYTSQDLSNQDGLCKMDFTPRCLLLYNRGDGDNRSLILLKAL